PISQAPLARSKRFAFSSTPIRSAISLSKACAAPSAIPLAASVLPATPASTCPKMCSSRLAYLPPLAANKLRSLKPKENTVNENFTSAGSGTPVASADLSAGRDSVIPDGPSHSPAVESRTFRERLVRELLSWVWVALAFFLITGTMVQARVIPSASMEGTLLIGDHLLMSRFGYDIGLPFTRYHLRLWREPRRQKVVVFHAPLPDRAEGFIKPLIGIAGLTRLIRRSTVRLSRHSFRLPPLHP